MLYLEGLQNNFPWINLFLNKRFVLLAFTNVVLMLSHPVIHAFPVAQGLFVYLYILYHNRLERIIIKTAKVAAFHFAQLVILVAIWGFRLFRFVASILGIAAGGFGGGAVGSSTIISATNSTAIISFKNPFVIFGDYFFSPNIDFPVIINKIINYFVPIRNLANLFWLLFFWC